MNALVNVYLNVWKIFENVDGAAAEEFSVSRLKDKKFVNNSDNSMTKMVSLNIFLHQASNHKY